MPDKLIRVEFIDAATNEVFAFTQSPIEQLPETFVLNTNVTIQGQEWEVVKAEPMTRKEYVQQGKLTLTLSKIMRVPIKDILYTLPTIYDPLPALEERTVAKENTLMLNADLWRCVEFVSKREQTTLEREFEAIAIIYQDHRVGQGFNKLHIRTKPTAPVAGLLRLTELRALFAGTQSYEAIGFHREHGVAKNVFAFRYGAWALYGDHNGEMVQSLALEPQHERPLPLDPILQIMRIYDLLLVDWVNVNPMSYQEADIFLKQYQQQ